MDKNDIKVTITEQVEKEYTLNQLTMEVTDLRIKRTSLQNEIAEIDEKLAEIENLKITVDKKADEIKEATVVEKE